MSLLEMQTKLKTLGVPVIQTSDASACLKITRQHASQVLGRLAKVNVVFPLARGLFAFTDNADPLTFPEYLTAPCPAYISLQTALYYHGVLSQIPDVIYAVSIARTRQYKNKLGVISIHHMEPEFFFGFEVIGENQIKMACVEKALLDILYLSSARSHLFQSLPEVELPKNFDIVRAYDMIKKIPSLRLKTLVTRRLEVFLQRRK
jgi:predicted transcriptional regulator of viral defense system